MFVKDLLCEAEIKGLIKDENKFIKFLTEKINNMVRLIKDDDLHLSKKEKKDVSLDKLILLSYIEFELWREDFFENKNPKIQNRKDVFATILYRQLLQLKESMLLIFKNTGISATSNLRTFLEGLAISKWILEKGESEAERYKDHYQLEWLKMNDENYKNSSEYRNLKLKYPNDDDFFDKDYGWCSKPNKTNSKPNKTNSKTNMTMTSLIKNLEINGVEDIYKLTCCYVHMSSYSLVKIIDDEFPLEKEKLISINEQVVLQMINLILEYFVDEEEKSAFLYVLSFIDKIFDKESTK